MELLPAARRPRRVLNVYDVSVVGHRTVYASQKIRLSKSGGLDVPIDAPTLTNPYSAVDRKGSRTQRPLPVTSTPVTSSDPSRTVAWPATSVSV